jgi:hypothetical protein
MNIYRRICASLFVASTLGAAGLITYGYATADPAPPIKYVTTVAGSNIPQIGGNGKDWTAPTR